MKRNKVIAWAMAFGLLTAGCVNMGAVIDPSCTMPPAAVPEAVSEPSPAPEQVKMPDMADLSSAFDEKGAAITTPEHFRQYITFKNIQVYEQHDDTFMDAIAVNDYPRNIVCAMNIVFYDEDGGVMADSRVQTRDGQYVLRLEPGENTLFAQIDTDMRITGMDFSLEFSPELDVLPE